MNEGPNNEIEQAETELTNEDLEKVESLFPNGEPQTDEEKLLYERVVMELSTTPEGSDVDLEKIVKEFEEERAKAKSSGGYDVKDYTIHTGKQPGAGTVDMGINIPEDQ